MTDFKTLLPPNSLKLQKDLEIIFAKRMAILGSQNKDITNPEKCPAHVLPWLAWEMSVDVWNENWAEEIRREVIKASLHVHKRKGTIGALKSVLKTFNFESARIEEWFEYGGNPYTFRVLIENTTEGFKYEDFFDVSKIIKITKNVRSHLEQLKFSLVQKTELPQIGGSFFHAEQIEFYPDGYFGKTIKGGLIIGETTILKTI